MCFQMASALQLISYRTVCVGERHSVLWLHLDPVPIAVCGRILPFSGAWAGPRKGIPNLLQGVYSTRVAIKPPHLASKLLSGEQGDST
jgi:hypothetical protein